MSQYALIKNGTVVNTAIWDGEGDIFSEYDNTIEITEEFPAAIGDAYYNGQLYPNPKDGYDYVFDSSSLLWTMTTESAALKSANIAADNLATAQSEYDRSTTKIDALSQQIEDEDYSDTDTAASVAAAKTAWTTYRKALRAYLAAGDGSATLPTAADASS